MSCEVKTMPFAAKTRPFSSKGMIFKGKVDWWFYAIMILIAVNLVPIIVVAFMDGMTGAAVFDLLVLAVVEVFCGLIAWRNYIRLEGNGLTIVFGLIQLSIRYSEISGISETHNPLASLAASLDRIEIKYRRSCSVMVAVVEKQAFIEEINKRIRDCQ